MTNPMTFTPIAPSELIEAIAEEVMKRVEHRLPQEAQEEKSEEEYLNIKQACEFLKCSTVKLWRLRKEGKIPYEECGRTILIKREDLKDFLSKTTKKGGQDA
ncbi:helix-turn-helix domain-containing protein [Psychroflexus sp. CAK57W]|uniref:helix-turn-helix domain-containing protein n=1 Tax=Psychroflexus curvus TaxID=2873595 RepID=UPI001CCEA9AB|nr:helix-turn-helix domain-containing protein [Psychroflexus curvus]MBZ9788199.1 helix-turn-helix domain-containing protein [Psychroflexus curvus]